MLVSSTDREVWFRRSAHLHAVCRFRYKHCTRDTSSRFVFVECSLLLPRGFSGGVFQSEWLQP